MNCTRIQACHMSGQQELTAISEIGWSSVAGVLTSTLTVCQSLGESTGHSDEATWDRPEATFTR